MRGKPDLTLSDGNCAAAMEKTEPKSVSLLDDISATSLNVKNAWSQVSRKRKRDIDDKNDINASPQSYFVASVLPIQSAGHSPTFTCIAVLSRAYLPLTWLNTTQTTSSLPAGFLFKATIPFVQQWDRRVLIACQCPNGGLFAIERVDSDSFIACALHDWVSPEHCEAAALGNICSPGLKTILNSHRQFDIQQDESSTKVHSDVLKIGSAADPKVPKNRKGALARMSIMTTKNDTAQGSNRVASGKSQSSPVNDCASDPSEAPKINSDATGCHTYESIAEQDVLRPGNLHDEIQADPSIMKAAEVAIMESFPAPEKLSTDQLHRQYMETLYLSKTSLAFYSKGPLGRARAQAQSNDGEISSKELVELYSRIILPVKKMDTKYKDSLAGIIVASKDRLDRLADGTQTGESKRVRKARKKVKLGKDGLWTDEEDYILRCWNSRELNTRSINPQDSQDNDMRRHISDLRIRESEMQLLIMLEVLYLELIWAKDSQMRQDIIDPAVKVESTELDIASINNKVPKKKKPHDLNSDIETIIDRLCIWHTVGADEWFISPTKPDYGKDSASQSKDKLRDFCAEVIIPFYASKLPDQCKLICQKLGGPEISPQRPRSQPKRPISSMRRPAGSSSKTTNCLTNRRTLERVLSEDQSTRHASPPVLSRSSTLPLASNFKREPSERPKSRGGMHKSVSFTNREIDLVADARAQEVKQRKLKQLTAQKQELQSAIDSLKKPNRVSMAKSFMDDIERRGTDKQKIVQQVQIMATPRKNKHSRTILNSYDADSLSVPQNNVQEDRIVLSSTSKPSAIRPGNISNSSATKRAVLTAIHETPSKYPSKLQSTIDKQIPTSSPLPKASLDQPMLRQREQQPSPIPSTPLKSKTRTTSYDIPETAGKAMDRVMGFSSSGDRDEGKSNMNIYKKLGWWDDDDL